MYYNKRIERHVCHNVVSSRKSQPDSYSHSKLCNLVLHAASQLCIMTLQVEALWSLADG
jgi:hypothetical protein